MYKLHQLAKNNQLTELKELIKTGVDLNSFVDGCYTTLHHAVKENNLDAVNLLIDAGADLNVKSKVGGFTALYIAAFMINLSAVKLLINAGADPNIKDDQNKITSLHCAALGSDSNIVKSLILAGANLNIRDNDGQTALHMAARMENLSAIKVLINAGANSNIRDKNGKTAQELALDNGKIVIANAIQSMELTKDTIKICEDKQMLGSKLPSLASHLKEDKLLKLKKHNCLEKILSYVNDKDTLQSLKEACKIELCTDLMKKHNINTQALGESGEEFDIYDNAQ
ncbi:ankyrin repeat family protein [Orientia chuto str. Dubai]|uniref:Ankyrin repeat family protein n=1 Tax=Orientia chuto str. Dubai TaxID=1359168 RepID=A0A0F3MG04_9RICK|nr:ankyrin repeat domain-containing protein [Candidatus Orientia mediorientalis]KJV54693.1 ankyrin repeat family protein [Orientia chuto str. Dubai]